MKDAVAIRHVAFEDLGSFADVLAEHDYSVRYLESGVDDLATLDPQQPDLLVILGGPLGVYQDNDYPYLHTEVDLARRRMEVSRPTLGICLGSQIMAHALGAKVLIAEQDEVGWAPVELTADGRGSPLWRLDGTPVMHWHGDRFELPPGAERLAATSACPNQAFRVSQNVLGLQFHPEVRWPELEQWLIGHTRSLSDRDESVPRLRADSERNCAHLVPAAQQMLADWLEALDV